MRQFQVRGGGTEVEQRPEAGKRRKSYTSSPLPRKGNCARCLHTRLRWSTLLAPHNLQVPARISLPSNNRICAVPRIFAWQRCMRRGPSRYRQQLRTRMLQFSPGPRDQVRSFSPCRELVHAYLITPDASDLVRVVWLSLEPLETCFAASP